ncbi:hypothetical protein [Oleiagrimonas citrea]|nr:hypothetical protein [Oleiagrimonas citrea]
MKELKMKKIMRTKLLALLSLSLLYSEALFALPPDNPPTTTTAPSSTTSPTQKIKFYGYDWLDYYQFTQPAMNPSSAKNAIYTTGFSKTNLNVVHRTETLDDSACASGTCALGINAGSGTTSGSLWTDICPGAINDQQCTSLGSWQNIWNIVATIKQATYKPSAIYFIDEPFDNKALQENGNYVSYRYPSYICTLREAMQHYGLNIPVFTVLSYNQAHTAKYVGEIQNQMPSTGCPTTYNSRPDWIGIDNYHWSDSDMWSTYTYVAPPSNPSSQKWVMVPPSTASLGMTDQQLHDQIQIYWDFIWNHQSAPIIAIMNWHFDRNVTLDPNTYPKTTALLSYMANEITPAQ